MKTRSIVRRGHIKELARFAGVACLLLLVAQPALAAPWRYASWGRAWVTVGPRTAETVNLLVRNIEGQTQDTKTDGYCVYIRARLTGQSWPAIGNRVGTVSCGSITSFGWGVTFRSGDLAGIRLYRDDGRYLTLWGS